MEGSQNINILNQHYQTQLYNKLMKGQHELILKEMNKI